MATTKQKLVERGKTLNWKIENGRAESIAEHIYGTQMLAIAMSQAYDYDIDLYKDTLEKISFKNKDIKINKMIEVYKSQNFIKSYFNQMFEYENFQKYK